MNPTLAMLLLADGRFPAGGHAHSAGVEAAIADRRITDEPTLEDFVRGRLLTTGLVDAALTAATAHRLGQGGSTTETRVALLLLDEEANVRIVADSLRDASRRLGRQLARAAARCWPDSLLALAVETFPAGAHQSVVLGAVAVATGIPAEDAARLSVHHSIATPAQAGVRLLGLDPFGVAALSARLGEIAEHVVAVAMACADGPLLSLPARAAPLTDIAATVHAHCDVRLFAT